MTDEEDLVALLAASGMLGALPSDALRQLVQGAVRQSIPAGDRLYAEGQSSSSLAVVLTGHLVARRNGVTVAEITRGGVTGELGVLTNEPRLADVVALRDTEVLIIGRAAVIDALMQSPAAALRTAAVVAEMLRRPSITRRPAAVVTVRAASPRADVTRLAASLATALGADLVSEPVPGQVLSERISRAEHLGGRIVIISSGEGEWRTLCERQGDVLLSVVYSGDAPVPVAGDERRELVILHPPNTQPRGSSRWLGDPAPTRHHVRHDNAGDIARLARRLSGAAVGLALSGGGCRALAHLGVYKELRDAGFPIDLVSGASIGAVTGIQIATHADPIEMIEVNRDAFVRADFGRRPTLPILSILSLRSALPLFERLFGDLDLADTVAPCLVSVVNFTTCELIHRDVGPAGLWARASASPPGLWPPVAIDGELFVDGAVLDNLPVDALRARGAAKVLAVTVVKTDRLAVRRDASAVTSWTALADPRRRFASGYPKLPKVMMRLGQLSSLPRHASAVAEADIVLEPTVGSIGLGDYRLARKAIDAGSDAARRLLDERGDELLSWAVLGKPG